MTGYPARHTAVYAAFVFVTSALVLVLEIVAARLIAPFVGVSLYSWTAIIGVILAGLSLGNWIGGVWADREGGEHTAGWTLLGAGLSAYAILLILPRLAGPLQSAELSLATTSLVLAGALFFVPAALLGIITPLLTTLALRGSGRPGHVVGLMHALAALGSIVGTFITGFWLVQWVGSRNVVLVTGTVLVFLSLLMLRRPGAAVAGLVLGAGVLLPALLIGYPDPCERESSYFCLRVVDSSAEAPSGEARSLVLDHLLHGTNHRQFPELILAPYLHLMDELAAYQTAGLEPVSYFFAGGGAYTLPRAARVRDPDAGITVAELDPVVTQTAAERLFVDVSTFDIDHLDARVSLANRQQLFDVVIGDVFHDIAVPQHLLTEEFARLVASRLEPHGIYLMNVVDAFPDARLVKAIHNTLSRVFDDVDVWTDRLPTEPVRLTYVISARNRGPAIPDQYSAHNGMPRSWYRVTGPLLSVGQAIEDIPVLTDNYAPVERLMAALFLGRYGR